MNQLEKFETWYLIFNELNASLTRQIYRSSTTSQAYRQAQNVFFLLVLCAEGEITIS